MQVRLKILVCLFPLAMLMGCGDSHTQEDKSLQAEVQKKPGVYISEKSILLKDMSDGDVIARVNGVNITKRDFVHRRKLMDRLYRIKKNLPMKGKNKKAASHLKYREGSIIEELMKRELMKQGADKAGIQYNSKRASRLFKETVKDLGCPRETKETFKKRIGPELFDLLSLMIKEDARAEVFLQQSTTNDLSSVSEERIAAYKAKVDRFDARSKKKNEKSYQRAMKFREKVLNGADFKKLGLKAAQVSPNYVEEWESFQLMELESGDPLRKWLETAKVGELSMPIDLDDGLAIVKLVSKEKADTPEGMEPVYDYNLTRCTFFAYQYAIDQTDDEIRDMLLDESRNEARQRLGEKLVSEAVIEFPNGNQFFPKPKAKGAKK